MLWFLIVLFAVLAVVCFVFGKLVETTRAKTGATLDWTPNVLAGFLGLGALLLLVVATWGAFWWVIGFIAAAIIALVTSIRAHKGHRGWPAFFAVFFLITAIAITIAINKSSFDSGGNAEGSSASVSATASPSPTGSITDSDTSVPVDPPSDEASDEPTDKPVKFVRGDGTARDPREVKLEDFGNGGCLVDGRKDLEYFRENRSDYTFKSPYEQPELTDLKERQLQFLKMTDAPCVRDLVKYRLAKFGARIDGLYDWGMKHMRLKELQEPLTVQNSYYDANNRLVWWDVQTFPKGELVYFAGDEPVMKYICGNALRPVHKTTPKTSTPTSHAPQPSTHRPKPTPSKTQPAPKPPAPAPTIFMTAINDVPFGISTSNFCVKVGLYGSHSGRVTLYAKQGKFEPARFTAQGRTTNCDITYVGPAKKDQPELQETVIATVVDSSTGKKASTSQTFGVNRQPPRGRP